jgi:hypothetical protein
MGRLELKEMPAKSILFSGLMILNCLIVWRLGYGN